MNTPTLPADEPVDPDWSPDLGVELPEDAAPRLAWDEPAPADLMDSWLLDDEDQADDNRH